MTKPAAQTMNRQQRRAQASNKKPAAPTLTTEFAAAITAFNAGDLAQAKTLAEATVEKAPHHEHAWNILGNIAEREGSTEKAIEIFEQAVKVVPRGAELRRNLAALLFKLNRFEDAETHLKRALELKPGYENAAWLLGHVYVQQHRYPQAEAAYRIAAAADPKQAKYPMQLAKVLELSGRRSEMEPLVAAAINAARASNETEILHEGLMFLGGLLFHRGARLQGLPYLHEAVARGAGRAAETQFAECIGNIRFAAPHPELKPLLTRAFKEVWIRPADIMRVSSGLLFHEPAFMEARALVTSPGKVTDWLAKDCIKTIANDPLLLALLTATMITDGALELLLTICRQVLLETRLQGGDISSFAPFVIALAHQGFANEHAFNVTAGEETLVAKLEASIASALDNAAPIPTTDIALLAAYRALHTCAFAEKMLALPWPLELLPVIKRQVHEPFEERALHKTITCITPITDAVSSAVRNQYEENPYPRWMETPGKKEAFTLASWLRAYFPQTPAPVGDYADPLEILVAGCGTGQQSVNSAQRFARSNVLAVDLSLASLAYAIRKTNEFGITNVTYAQGDILELGALNRVFDMVECGGVLHHLADPLKGWRVLTDLTRPGGYMVIALYSELARKYLEPVRAYAKEQGFGNSAEELRRFRASMFALPADHPATSIINRRDFYSLSMVRDLVFHVQEHRFTIPKLIHACKELGLEFAGFSLPPESKQKFMERFSAAANFLSLDQWAIYEEEIPETFLGMYQFLVKKPATA